VAALLKNPVAYQPFRTEETGRAPTDFVIGKHSGSAGLRAALEATGISVPAAAFAEILTAVRQRSRAKKDSVSVQELAAIARQWCQEGRSNPDANIRA
jgi:homocitrate synthase NifV